MITFKQFLVEELSKAKIRKIAQQLNVYLTVNYNLSPDTWHLEGIERGPRSQPGDGIKVLKALLQLAK